MSSLPDPDKILNFPKFLLTFIKVKIILFILWCEKTFAFLGSPVFHGILRVSLAIFSFVLLILVTYFMEETGLLKEVILDDIRIFFFSPKKGSQIRKEAWKNIESLWKKGGIENLRQAIIEADKLLDEALNRMGYKGENLTEKLKEISPEIVGNIEELRKAHAFKEKISQDKEAEFSLREGEVILSVYEQTFKQLGLI